MKALVAAFLAFLLSTWSSGPVSAQGARVSGHSGARLSHSSARSFHSGGLHVHVGPHLRSAGHPFLHHRFGQPFPFHHRPFFLRAPFGRQTIFLYHPFGFYSGVLFRDYVVGPSSAIISPYPYAPGLRTPVEEPRLNDQYPSTDRPLITFILNHRSELGLSPEQVQSLEKLRSNFQREAIRHEADIRIAEVDLGTLLKGNVVDLGDVKIKLEEVERLRTELRLARIRTIEQGKAVLFPEQHGKLQSILGEP